VIANWRNARRAQIAILGLALLAQSCSRGSRFEKRSFESLRQADRLEVRKGGAHIVAASADPAVIATGREFILSRSDGWSEGLTGAPRPVFVAFFYSGNRLLGGFGVGRAYLTSQPASPLYYRVASPQEVAAIAAALRVSLEDVN
jgi:hypothetical protein